MRRVTTLIYAVVFTVTLAAGCSRPPPQRVEELESEDVRQERRMRLEKMAPQGTAPSNAGAEK